MKSPTGFKRATRALGISLLLATSLPAGQALAQEKTKSVTRIPVSQITRFSKQIDQLINVNLQRKGQSPNPRASDEVFLRRTYLNIIGRIPTHQEAVAFLEKRSATKRSDLIDQLLDSPGYTSHQFNLWADILRARTAGRDGTRHGGVYYVPWLKEQIGTTRPRCCR